MEEDTSIDEGWTFLTSMARKISAIDEDSKSSFQERHRVQQLLSALPDRFSSVKDSLDIAGQTDPDRILSVLYEKEAVFNRDTAMYTSGRGKQLPRPNQMS